MTGHAEFSPSGAHRWIECPGSVALCRDIPGTDSVYAREGTFAHELAANCLRDGTPASEMLNKTDGEFRCDAEMVEHIQTYLDYVRGIQLTQDGTLLVEQKVAVNEDVYGTADAILLCDDVMHVVDFKYGAGQFVSVEGNEQLQTYGLAALLAQKHPVREVVLHIVQPRCPADRPCRSASVMAIWLRTHWEPVLLNAVAEARKPGAALKPGDHCKFCPARNNCPALREQALIAAKDIFVDQTLLSAAVKPPSPANMTPEQIATVLTAQDLLETWLKGCYEMAVDLAGKGQLPGYKLVNKIGNRAWRDEATTTATLTSAGVSPWAPQKLLSPNQAEKALTKLHGGKRAEALVETLAHKPVTGTTVVPVSDPRPALLGASVFTPIEN